MRNHHRFTVLAFAFFVASATARQIASWSYDRLFKEADVIVIASAQGTTASDDLPPDGRWKSALVGQRTTFSVINTLKGHVDDGPITVVHFKLKDGVATEDGPLLVAFRTEEIKIEGCGKVKYDTTLSTPQYLLFLKRSASRRLEPLSGQIDALLSVKEIYSPLPAVMDEK